MNKYLSQFKLTLINRLDYRQELIMSSIIGLIIFAGQYFFWHMMYGGSDTLVIKGYTFAQIMLYYFILRVISDIVDSKVGVRMSELILSGKISSLLVKPVNFRGWLLSEEISRLLPELLLKLGVFTTLYIGLFSLPQMTVVSFMLFCFSVALSFLLSFALFLLLGTLAFYFEAIGGLNYVMRRLVFFLSGGLVPIAFFPSAFQQILQFLPFKYIFDLPVQLLMNAEYGAENIAQGLVAQMAWLLFIWYLGHWALKYSIKNNQSVGI